MSSKIDQHGLIQALQNMAIELGYTPSRDAFADTIRGGKQQIQNVGGYDALVIAAGLQKSTTAERRKGLSNAIFETSIDKHLESYRAEDAKKFEDYVRAPYPHAAIISDIHWPFHNQRVIDRFFRYVDDEKPEWVILDGDAWDMYSHAKFPRSHNLFTPKDEEDSAHKSNEEFWKQIISSSPKSKCHQLMGNHDVRPLKRTMEVMPTMEHWIKERFNALFTFEGVKTIFDPREELFLPADIMVHHGYRTKLGDHRDYALYSAVVGHTHRPGVVWRNVRNRPLFELNCGLAGDPNAKGLTYTSQKLTDWVAAFGVIDSDGPRNITI